MCSVCITSFQNSKFIHDYLSLLPTSNQKLFECRGGGSMIVTINWYSYKKGYMGEVGMMSTQGLNRCLVIKKVLVIIHQTYALLNWQLDYQDWWSQNPPVHGLTYSTEPSFHSLYPYLQFSPLGSHQNTLSLQGWFVFIEKLSRERYM